MSRYSCNIVAINPIGSYIACGCGYNSLSMVKRKLHATEFL